MRSALPFLPASPVAIVELALIAVGIAVLMRRDMPKSYGLGVLIILVYALDSFASLFHLGSGAGELAFSLAALQAGAWWTPVSAMFVHAGFAHLFGNLIILVTAGPALEDRIGDRKFLVIYYLAGLASFAAHAVLSVTTAFVHPETFAVGASGAIFGVLSTLAIRHPMSKLPLLLPVMMPFLLMVPAIAVLLIYLAFNLVYAFSDYLGFGSTGTAWWGHFAGFLVGMAFAYTLPKADPRFESRGGRLPDPEKLALLATTPELRRILERIRAFGGEGKTKDDAALASAWIDRFFEKARCPNGHRYQRSGFHATCDAGESTVDFAQDRRESK